MQYKISRTGQIHYAISSLLLKKRHYKKILLGIYLIIVGLLFYLGLIKSHGSLVSSNFDITIGTALMSVGAFIMIKTILSLKTVLNIYRKIFYTNVIELKISDEKITIENSLISATYDWTLFKHFKVTKEAIYLYSSTDSLIMVFILRNELSEKAFIEIINILTLNPLLKYD